jgi:hypothetical protein
VDQRVAGGNHVGRESNEGFQASRARLLKLGLVAGTIRPCLHQSFVKPVLPPRRGKRIRTIPSSAERDSGPCWTQQGNWCALRYTAGVRANLCTDSSRNSAKVTVTAEGDGNVTLFFNSAAESLPSQIEGGP